MKKIIFGLMVLPLYVYALYIAVPSIIFYLDQTEGIAKIESINKEKLSFSYYHKDKKERIKLSSKIPYIKHQKMLAESEEWNVIYSKMFPELVCLIKIDAKPSLFIPLVLLSAIFLPLLLYDKINWENPFVMKDA